MADNCTFNCGGCATGIDARRAKDPIRWGIDTTIIKKIIGNAINLDLTKLHLKYAGGEPLLAFKKIVEVQTGIKKARQKGIVVDQTILTNGVLLEKFAERIAKIPNVRVVVSLWGLGHDNDVRRGMPDKDWFPQIIAGIRKLHELGIDFNLQHTLTPENAHGFTNFLKACWDTNGENWLGKTDGEEWHVDKEGNKLPFRLSVSLFRPQDRILSFGEVEHIWHSGLNPAIVWMYDVIRRGGKIPSVSSFFDYMSFGNVHNVCATGTNYLAVSAAKSDGLIHSYRCHELMGSAGYITKETPIFKHEPWMGVVSHVFENNLMQIARDYGGAGCPNQRIFFAQQRLENGRHEPNEAQEWVKILRQVGWLDRENDNLPIPASLLSANTSDLLILGWLQGEPNLDKTISELFFGELPKSEQESTMKLFQLTPDWDLVKDNEDEFFRKFEQVVLDSGKWTTADIFRLTTNINKMLAMLYREKKESRIRKFDRPLAYIKDRLGDYRYGTDHLRGIKKSYAHGYTLVTAENESLFTNMLYEKSTFLTMYTAWKSEQGNLPIRLLAIDLIASLRNATEGTWWQGLFASLGVNYLDMGSE